MSKPTRGRSLPYALLAVAMLQSTPAVMAQAAKASGKVAVDASSVAIASVEAVGYQSPMGQLVTVLVSDQAPDAKTFAEDTKGAGPDFVPAVFSGAWKSQHFAKRFSGLTFTINDEGRIVDEEILVGGRNETFSIGSDEYTI
jgi:hypothetical protein